MTTIFLSGGSDKHPNWHDENSALLSNSPLTITMDICKADYIVHLLDVTVRNREEAKLSNAANLPESMYQNIILVAPETKQELDTPCISLSYDTGIGRTYLPFMSGELLVDYLRTNNTILVHLHSEDFDWLQETADGLAFSSEFSLTCDPEIAHLIVFQVSEGQIFALCHHDDIFSKPFNNPGEESIFDSPDIRAKTLVLSSSPTPHWTEPVSFLQAGFNRYSNKVDLSTLEQMIPVTSAQEHIRELGRVESLQLRS